MIKDVFTVIEIIQKVKAVALNENEKKIVVKLILSFDKSNFFEPSNAVQYAFNNNKSKLKKIHYFQEYLSKHADAISEALSESNDTVLIEKLKGFKKINIESQQKLEMLNISPYDLKRYANSELPKFKKVIDYYRTVMCYAVISLIETIEVDDRKVSKTGFLKIIKDFENKDIDYNYVQ